VEINSNFKDLLRFLNDGGVRRLVSQIARLKPMPQSRGKNPSRTAPKPSGAAVRSVKAREKQHLVSDLGWTRKRASQVRAALRVFEDDWNAPGMEAYDKRCAAATSFWLPFQTPT
jgi:hypothetical protein